MCEKITRMPPRVAAIHDLSCFGRCALTVIIPTLSCLGVQTVPVPTALLSTHTGGFEGMHFRDLTSDMTDIGAHFDRLSMTFDAIYSGFLGSEAQIEVVSDFIDRFGKDIPVLIDPVMGDDGVLYSTYNNEMRSGMMALCRKASMITPNYTEACFLTGTEYRDTAGMSEAEFCEYTVMLADKLSATGAHKTVITGIHKGESRLCVCGKDNITNEFFSYDFDRVERNYPGTGDLFASVLLGGLLKGRDFKSAVCFAADYTGDVMKYSACFDTPTREGVAIEGMLGRLCEE